MVLRKEPKAAAILLPMATIPNPFNKARILPSFLMHMVNKHPITMVTTRQLALVAMEAAIMDPNLHTALMAHLRLYLLNRTLKCRLIILKVAIMVEIMDTTLAQPTLLSNHMLLTLINPHTKDLNLPLTMAMDKVFKSLRTTRCKLELMPSITVLPRPMLLLPLLHHLDLLMETIHNRAINLTLLLKASMALPTMARIT